VAPGDTLPPSKPQLVRGSIPQSSNLGFDVVHFGAVRFVPPVVGLIDGMDTGSPEVW